MGAEGSTAGVLRCSGSDRSGHGWGGGLAHDLGTTDMAPGTPIECHIPLAPAPHHPLLPRQTAPCGHKALPPPLSNHRHGD